MKHLSELLERLEHCKKTYKEADSSLDGGSLAWVIAHDQLKAARFEWLAACEQFVLEEVLTNEQ